MELRSSEALWRSAQVHGTPVKRRRSSMAADGPEDSKEPAEAGAASNVRSAKCLHALCTDRTPTCPLHMTTTFMRTVCMACWAAGVVGENSIAMVMVQEHIVAAAHSNGKAAPKKKSGAQAGAKRRAKAPKQQEEGSDGRSVGLTGFLQSRSGSIKLPCKSLAPFGLNHVFSCVQCIS